MWKSFRHPITFDTFSCGTEFFENFVVNIENNLDPDIRDTSNYSIFRKSFLTIIRPFERKTYHINDSVEIKLLTRLRLSFSHLHEHRHLHCLCNIEPEITALFFLRFYFYNENRAILNDLENID